MGSAFVLEEKFIGYWHVKAVCSANSVEEAKKLFDLKYDCDWDYNRIHEVPHVDS